MPPPARVEVEVEPQRSARQAGRPTSGQGVASGVRTGDGRGEGRHAARIYFPVARVPGDHAHPAGAERRRAGPASLMGVILRGPHNGGKQLPISVHSGSARAVAARVRIAAARNLKIATQAL